MAKKSTDVPAITDRLNGALTEKKADEGQQIVIERISPKILEIEIVGTTPLLVCAWSHKAQQEMLDAQMKKAKTKKGAKNPEADYQASLYKSTEGWTGIPAGGMKGCLVNACRAVDGLPMTLCKRMIFVQSDGVTADGQELVRIYGEHTLHRAMVRLPNGSADIRFRACYKDWGAKLRIEFLSNVVSAEQVANLVELAGYIEGLCEHRPGAPKSCTGNKGRFVVRRSD